MPNTDDLNIPWDADVFDTLGRDKVAAITDAAAHKMVADMHAINAALTKHRRPQ